VDAIATQHGELRLPAFLPDATRGVVRALDARDLEACGVPGVVVSAFHLAQRPGSRTVRRLGGIHRLMAWRLATLHNLRFYSMLLARLAARPRPRP
jgi:queuine tRNA-ribosyltransferase